MKRKLLITLTAMLLGVIIIVAIYYESFERMLVLYKLSDYKELLFETSTSTKVVESLASGDMEIVSQKLDDFKVFFTEEGFMQFYSNRLITLYSAFPSKHQGQKLSISDITVKSSTIDLEGHRCIIYYVVEFSADDVPFALEDNQVVFVRDGDAGWRIQNETLSLKETP